VSVNLEAMELRKRLATEREQGAREERARIVDAIERGEHDEKANA
jgi:hypothetical protein